MDSQFFYYYLETQKQLTQHTLEKVVETFPLAMPHLYEQRKIVTLLQQHDDTLQKLRVEQDALRHFTQGVMELVFSGKLPSKEVLTMLQSS